LSQVERLGQIGLQVVGEAEHAQAVAPAEMGDAGEGEPSAAVAGALLVALQAAA
jgi:hypothetical protein